MGSLIAPDRARRARSDAGARAPVDASPRAPAPDERRLRAWTAVALAVGLALRLARPEVHSLWIDEGMSVVVARAADPFALLHVDSHPPLSFLLLRGWIALLGESDLALRLLSAIVSCVSLALFAPLARAWLGRERAPWAIALYAVAPLLVWYAHEVRMYALVECATLATLHAARRAWAAPSLARWAALALATAVATGLHYFGAFAGAVVVVQAFANGRPVRRTAIAASIGVVAWTPWLVAYLPDQQSGAWPVIVRSTPRDLAELPARLIAVDLAVLVEHGLAAVGWILAGLALAGLVAGCATAIARSAAFRTSALASSAIARRLVPRASSSGASHADAVVAALVPIAAAVLLALLARGGFQPRYVTTSIPGLIATVTAGLFATRYARVGSAAAAILVASAATTTVLQLSENRREDYRAASAEIRERWRDGDRLLMLVCVPDASVTAAAEHYLRDRPEILASRLDADDYLAGIDRPPSGTRVHVLWREATVCWEPIDRLTRSHVILERSPARFRIHRFLTTVP